MKKPPAVATAGKGSVTILCIDPNDADRESLARIFHESDWSLYTDLHWALITRSTMSSAVSTLRQMPIPVVICEADQSHGLWQEILDSVSFLPNPPLVIITSRLADERLWAECLNVGAYDVLAKPFETSEVIRILSLACLHWLDRRSFPIGAIRMRAAMGV